MTRPRSLFTAFFATIMSVGLVVACTGDKGDPGAAGMIGAAGPTGPAGPEGPAGPTTIPDAGGGACTAPCHTFGGVVDEWKLSAHSHPQESEVTPGEACGNCHAVDGIQQRVANMYSIADDAGTPVDVPKGHTNFLANNGKVTEIGYGGSSTIGLIHCTTCHDFNSTNDPHVTGKYVAGSAPIRVPGGPNDVVYLEKSPDGGAGVGQTISLKAANVCVFCHKSRKDVTAYVTATGNVLSSPYWGPHEGPQSDIYSGKGGYEFAGMKYGTSTHMTIANACVSCHMGPNPDNANVPDHSLVPKVSFCKTCHTTYQGTNYDVQGGQSLVRDGLFELQGLLNDAGYLTRSTTKPNLPLQPDELADGQFALDKVRAGSGTNGSNLSIDGPHAGALYNFLLVAHGGDFGVHNPTYTKQLLWDSIVTLKGSDPSSLPSRPQ